MRQADLSPGILDGAFDQFQAAFDAVHGDFGGGEISATRKSVDASWLLVSHGGFYSAEDTDSDGEKGTFYLWDDELISEILDKEQARLFNAYFGITDKGHFEKGKTILSIVGSEVKKT